MHYLGVRRRTWAAMRTELKPVRIGTSLIYDRRDLDVFFDRLKSSQKPTRSSQRRNPPDVEDPLATSLRSAWTGGPLRARKEVTHGPSIGRLRGRHDRSVAR